MRVVSLLPAATEIVCALGAGDRLVGRSHECDFPPAVVSGLPVLTRERRRLPGSSAEIDREVRAALEQALSLYELDVDALRRADPDLIVTQDLCEVCALGKHTLLSAVRDVLRPETRVLSLEPRDLSHVLDGFQQLADALGLPEAGQRLVGSMRSGFSALAERTRAARVQPAVLGIEWLEPVMIGGLWMAELIAIAGGRPLVSAPGEPAATLSEAQLTALEPELVLVKPCGFGLERASAALDALAANPALHAWLGAEGRRVHVTDGSAYFNRSGPRLLDSAEILAACIHPALAADLGERHAGQFRRYMMPTA